MTPEAAQALREQLESQAEISAIRAQGAGGQNVNKVSNAIHLRFDIAASDLPVDWKERLLSLRDQRIGSDGMVVIKAQVSRSRERNRADALQRLFELVASVARPPRLRRATRPTFASKQRRLQGKRERSEIKSARTRLPD